MIGLWCSISMDARIVIQYKCMLGLWCILSMEARIVIQSINERQNCGAVYQCLVEFWHVRIGEC